jgi:hypothetical protein
VRLVGPAFRRACCTTAAHAAIKADAAAWASLRAVGYMDDGRGGRLELRNCSCGSTLARRIAR